MLRRACPKLLESGVVHNWSQRRKLQQVVRLLADSCREKAFASLRASPVVAIAWDCSGDITQHEKGVLEVRHMNSEQTRAVNTFTDICQVPLTDAANESIVILRALSALDMGGRVISMTADGAAVNWGVNNGILTRLGLRQDAVYCVPHRLQLAAAHITKFHKQVAEMADVLEGVGHDFGLLLK